MDRLHVGGFSRVGVELACEGLTLGLGGASWRWRWPFPAFRETSDEDWLKKQDLAVTFLDRYGDEIGQRGIRHDDSVPLEELPDYLIKAVLATEDRRFFEHFGIDVDRHVARADRRMRAPAAWCRAARRSPSSWPRTSSCPTSARSSARSRKPSWRCGSKRI